MTTISSTASVFYIRILYKILQEVIDARKHLKSRNNSRKLPNQFVLGLTARRKDIVYLRC